MRSIPKVAPEGIAWFLNEDGVAYDYDASKQAEDFPGDFHVAYPTEEAANAAADALDEAAAFGDDDDDRTLLNRALNCAVENGVITDSEADHLEQKLLPS